MLLELLAGIETIMPYNYNKAYFFKIDTTIKKIRNFMQKGLNEAAVDLTVDQWVVLEHLVQNKGISQIELGKITFKDPPTITRILDLVVAKGYIERKQSTSDRRKFVLVLTPLGEKIFQKANKIITDARKQAWENLSEEDYSALVRIMDTIYGNVQ